MSNLSTLPKGDSAWLLRKAIERIMQQVSVLETNIGSSTTGNSDNTQIIFNDDGTLRGDAGLVYNKTTDALTVAGLVTAASATITGDLTVRTAGLTVNANGVGVGVVGSLGAGNIQIGAGKYLGYSATAYITPEDNVQGARFKADNILIDGNTSTKFNIGGTSAMTLNATGLGVGGSPVSGNKLFVEGSAQIGSSSTAGAIRLAIDGLGTVGNVPTIRFRSAGVTKAYVGLSGAYIGDASTDLLLTTDAAGASVKFGSSDTGTVKMTLDASGNLLVGQTTVTGANIDSFVYNKSGSYASVSHVSGTSSGTGYIQFLYNNTSIGTIAQNGTTGVLYNITSDYRLKESVAPLSGGLARVNALKPSVYKWKSDGSTGEGFLAHELAEVVPSAVTGEKDAVNEDGSIKAQGIDMSRVVPILVAAIQELTAEVNALKNA